MYLYRHLWNSPLKFHPSPSPLITATTKKPRHTSCKFLLWYFGHAPDFDDHEETERDINNGEKEREKMQLYASAKPKRGIENGKIKVNTWSIKQVSNGF